MRIHSDKITEQDIRTALETEVKAGRIARTVTFKTLSTHKSKSHAAAFEVQLESWGKVDGDGRRAGNSGSYGAGEDYAATYDEWGWLLAALYRVDIWAVCGSPNSPVYADGDSFNERTGFTYAGQDMLDMLESGERNGDHGDPAPYVRKGARKVGRMGASRDDGRYASRWSDGYVYRPRTAAEYRRFAHLEKVPAGV
jgi:hypothetical protein